MKNILIMIAAFIISSRIFAQNSGMMGNDGHSSSYSNLSTTDMLLYGILLVIIVAVVAGLMNNYRREK